MIKQWADSFNSGSPEAVAGLYGVAGVLVPTLDSDVLASPESILSYMKNLVGEQQATVEMRDYLSEEHLGSLIENGFYVFSLPEGRPIEARFTMISQGGKVIAHHSSLVP